MQTNMNIEQARVNMIKQQIHPVGVIDEHILNLIQTSPREEFVPTESRNLAFADLCVPLPHDQVMMAPKEEAQLLQALQIKPHEKVLEIGTGTGYLTSLLASLAKEVISIDIFQEFTDRASMALQDHEITNVTLITGDASQGWHQTAPYDVVVVTGSVPLLPLGLREGLKVGGRLFVIVGQLPIMEAILFTHITEQRWQEKKLFETVLPPLINAPQPPSFIF